MIGLFLALSRSVFVPLSATHDFFLDIIDDKQFALMTRRKDDFFLLTIDELTSKNEMRMMDFAALPAIYPSVLTYYAITAESAPTAYRAHGDVKPRIIYFERGRSQVSFQYPSSESELMGIMTFLDRTSDTVIEDRKTLYSSFGDVPYTFVATTYNLMEAYRAMSELSTELGPIKILIATPKLITDLGFKDEYFLVYRQVDKELISTEKGLQEALRPSFHPKVTSKMLLKSTSPLGLLILDTKPTVEQKEILRELSSQFKYLSLGIINEKETGPIEEITNEDIQTPSFMVVDISQKLYYQPIPAQTFTVETTSRYLAAIEERRMTPQFISEPEAISTTTNGVKYLVGKTYEDFINQEGKDAIVMFGTPETLDYDFVEDVAQYIEEKGQHNIVVGVIDISKNSVPSGFPMFMLERSHVAMFPAGTHDRSIPLIGSMTVYNAIYGINYFCVNKVPLDEHLFVPESELGYVIYYVNDLETFRPEVRTYIDQYILSMGSKLGLGENFEQIVAKIHEIQGGPSNNDSERLHSKKRLRRKLH